MRKKTQKQRQKTRSKRIGTVSNSPTLYSYYLFIFDMMPRRKLIAFMLAENQNSLQQILQFFAMPSAEINPTKFLTFWICLLKSNFRKNLIPSVHMKVIIAVSS